MNKLFNSLLFFLLTISALSQSDHNTAPASLTASEKLTIEDWQSDLRFFQQTVHKDYDFLFKKTTAKDFDAAVEKLYKEIPGMKEHERIAGLLRIVAMFKYGHTRLGLAESQFKFHIVPVNFHFFSDGLYVEGADKKYASITGAKVIKVEGVAVSDALKSVKLLFPTENDQFFKAYGLDYIAYPEALHAQGVTKELKKSVTYTFEKNGKTFEQTIPAVESFRFPRNYGVVKPTTDWISARDSGNPAHYLKNLDKNYYYEYLPEKKTMYVRQSQVENDPQESIAEFYKKVFAFIKNNDVEKMVLDVRLNGGGNNYLNKPVVTGIIECEKINKPGKLFVIIGRRTFSACQNSVYDLNNYTIALFVGVPTGEYINFYGDNRRLDLPKTGIPVYLSFAWWQDKPQWENADWLAPQLAVDMSFDEYKANKDPVLDACLNFSEKDPVLDPMARLRDLFIAGNTKEVEEEAKKMVEDPKYRYINFETRINENGYNLLNAKQIEGALFVFQLNTKLFPKSANVWDSFAEANWKASKIDKAIEYYNKAIELDPNGQTGENARNMLKQIKEGN